MTMEMYQVEIDRVSNYNFEDQVTWLRIPGVSETYTYWHALAIF